MPKKSTKTKNVKKKDLDEAQEVLHETPTEKEVLLGLYDDLKARGIRSISDLENQIAQAE